VPKGKRVEQVPDLLFLIHVIYYRRHSPHTMRELDQTHYDAVVLGTGLVESIVAA
jgi:hypothetical protein